MQDMVTLTEAGFYQLVLRSDKPASQVFAKWVTTEVLPAIRKTGGYQVSARPGVTALLPPFGDHHWTDDRYPEMMPVRRLPGPEKFPPRRWSALYWTMVNVCFYDVGINTGSMELAERLRVERPELTVRQILRALPWMLVHRFGVGRSNDILCSGDRICRGYRNIGFKPQSPSLKEDVS